MGVGDRGDLRVRVLLAQPQRQRAPAAAELEDAHAVGDLGAFAAEREHRLLRLGERGVGVLEQAAAVLPPRPEHEPEERLGQLVVLLVGLRRDLRNRARALVLQQRLQPRL